MRVVKKCKKEGQNLVMKNPYPHDVTHAKTFIFTFSLGGGRKKKAGLFDD